MPQLSFARYGKDHVRVYKVHRDEGSEVQTVVEMTISVLLEGDIETSYALLHGIEWRVTSLCTVRLMPLSYTRANNAIVVATDSIKNTIYIMAKLHPVTPPELFASILGNHFVETYKHIHVAHVRAVVHPWARMLIDGSLHPHSFLRSDVDTRNAEVSVTRDSGLSIRSSISGLLVLKSTDSQFHGFIRDEYTTLPEVNDRILSTEVDCSWRWKDFASIDALRSSRLVFDNAWEDARTITLRVFAQDSSASVQNTMYKMCEELLATAPDVDAVSYSLPNKHYFEIGNFKTR